jgi:4-methyl-5(b-hydroxyethyl)-thiazole monophosphate biosynthesis
MKKVLVPLADGFEDIEAVSIIDVLRRGEVAVVTAALADEPVATSAHGIRMVADACLSDVLEEEYDAIILPGGGEGTNNLKKNAPLLERLARQKRDERLVCAICAAPLVLEEAGVLDGESVTCYPTCSPGMGRRVENVPVVADGLVVTGQGPGSAMLFALAVLAQLEGPKRAHSVANGLLTEFG